jgi:hypothetical protein
LKNELKSKQGWSMAQVVECFLGNSRDKPLISNLVASKKKKKREREKIQWRMY